jgi:hypothetical protein
MVLLVVLCAVIAVATIDRLPLWAVLLGAGTFAGCYEATYDAAASQVLSTSPSTVTSLLLTVAVGFLAGSLGGTVRRKEPAAHVEQRPRDEHPGFTAGVTR